MFKIAAKRNADDIHGVSMLIPLMILHPSLITDLDNTVSYITESSSVTG